MALSSPASATRARHFFAAATLSLLGGFAIASSAEARPGGCIKGAIVGGIAGHLVGHGGMGAAAGCAYGVHKRHEYDRETMGPGAGPGEGRSSYDGRSPSY